MYYEFNKNNSIKKKEIINDEIISHHRNKCCRKNTVMSLLDFVLYYYANIKIYNNNMIYFLKRKSQIEVQVGVVFIKFQYSSLLIIQSICSEKWTFLNYEFFFSFKTRLSFCIVTSIINRIYMICTLLFYYYYLCILSTLADFLTIPL